MMSSFKRMFMMVIFSRVIICRYRVVISDQQVAIVVTYFADCCLLITFINTPQKIKGILPAALSISLMTELQFVNMHIYRAKLTWSI